MTISEHTLTTDDVRQANAEAKECTEAAKALMLIGRLEGDAKSLGKRLRQLDKGDQWPEEIRVFLRYVREARDALEQKHPELTK
jgi:ribosomal protein L19E